MKCYLWFKIILIKINKTLKKNYTTNRQLNNIIIDNLHPYSDFLSDKNSWFIYIKLNNEIKFTL